jgi:hypothetical protein
LGQELWFGVERKTRLAHEPGLDRGGLVRRGIVEDDVHLEAGRHGSVDLAEEAAELPARSRGVISEITWPEATSRAA